MITEEEVAEATACNTYSLYNEKNKESILNQLHF